MSTGKVPQPCSSYSHWDTNPGLCGVCAWPKEDHVGHQEPSFIPKHTGSDYRKKRGPNFTKPKKRKKRKR